jgi:hypothetical protein
VRAQVLLDTGFLSQPSNGSGDGAPRHDRLGAAVAAHSRHAGEGALIAALLVAGLCPSVASAKQTKRGVKARTRDDGKVSFHPSSLLASAPAHKGCATSHFRLAIVSEIQGHARRIPMSPKQLCTCCYPVYSVAAQQSVCRRALARSGGHHS